MATAERTQPRWQAWLQRLHDPLHLRLGMTAMVLVLAYVGIYRPLSEQVAEADAGRSAHEKRLALAQDIEQLRARYQQIAPRIPTAKDSHELVEYILHGVRQRPGLRLVELRPETPAHLGPYQTAALSLELDGAFTDLCQFLRWLEVNPRLLRVDSVEIAPRRDGFLGMQLRIVGLMN